MLHKNISTEDNHYIQNWSVADNTARDALSVTAADVGKVCQVTGTSTYYILIDDSPMTWQSIGSGGSTNSFSTIAVSGQSNVVADSSTDTLTLVAGTNITITTDAGTDSITINSSGGGGSGITRGTATTLATQVNVNYGSLPSGLNRITVMWSALSVNGASGWTVRLGDSGGVENSGYTGRVSYIASTSANSYTLSSGCDWLAGTDSNNESGVLTFVRLNGNTWMFEGSDNRTDANVQYFMTGWKTLSAELTTVQFITVNGTDQFDNGTINIFYE